MVSFSVIRQMSWLLRRKFRLKRGAFRLKRRKFCLKREKFRLTRRESCLTLKMCRLKRHEFPLIRRALRLKRSKKFRTTRHKKQSTGKFPDVRFAVGRVTVTFALVFILFWVTTGRMLDVMRRKFDNKGRKEIFLFTYHLVRNDYHRYQLPVFNLQLTIFD
jgi:hypothetical protein